MYLAKVYVNFWLQLYADKLCNYTEQKYKSHMQQFQRLGARPTHCGPRPSQSDLIFPHKRDLLQIEIVLSFISFPGGWSQTIPQVKMTDVVVLGWHGYTWPAVVRPVGRTAKFSKTTLEEDYGRESNIQFSSNSSGGHACSQHANCTLPQNLRLLWHCVVWQNCIF